ncbi:MAG: M48 family metallopeptidase, partial [Leptolyngbyaceae cyanobacterium MAG.088]|nr:M48 family metallopeptidase [Leptolyngbyaceae cyanobacterium MAG.088]
VPNAYTFAMRGKQPFIVVHTSLIELLNDRELQAVIGHELGHLKCDHGVYLTLANLLALAASQLPLGPVVTQNLQSQILKWVRCAEFTCDRAALLVSQNSRTVASVLMKLAGGSPNLSAQLNLDAFLEQANAYENLSQDQLGALLKEMRTQELTHPVPVLRAKEITQWHGSQDYQKLLQTRSIHYNSETTGGWRNW